VFNKTKYSEYYHIFKYTKLIIILVTFFYFSSAYCSSFIETFNKAQSAYTNAINNRNPKEFQKAINLMENLLNSHKIASNIYYLNSTLGRSYMGLALSKYPKMGLIVYNNSDVKQYINYLEKAYKHINISIRLLETSTFADDNYGLQVDRHEKVLMQSILSRISNRLTDSKISNR